MPPRMGADCGICPPRRHAATAAAVMPGSAIATVDVMTLR
jgi:hypothetical protein